MKAQDLINLYEDIEKSGGKGDFLFGNSDKMNEVGDYMNSMANSGKEIVLSKLSERGFVQIINVMRATLLSSMIVADRGGFLSMAEMGGELKSYTDTIILTTLGVLADEEVI